MLINLQHLATYRNLQQACQDGMELPVHEVSHLKGGYSDSKYAKVCVNGLN